MHDSNQDFSLLSMVRSTESGNVRSFICNLRSSMYSQVVQQQLSVTRESGTQLLQPPLPPSFPSPKPKTRPMRPPGLGTGHS